MVAVFREVKRVLRNDGVLWLNIGDSFCSTPAGKPSQEYIIDESKGDGAYARKYRNNHQGGYDKDKDARVSTGWKIPGLKPLDRSGFLLSHREPRWQTPDVPTNGTASDPKPICPIRVAVVGTGSLGKEHARIYAELAAARRVELTGVFDSSSDTARKVAAKHNTCAFGSAADLARSADAIKHRHAYDDTF